MGGGPSWRSARPVLTPRLQARLTGDSNGMPTEGQSSSGRLDDQTVADAAQLLRAVLVALPPERPQDRATARRLEGAVLALELQFRKGASDG